MRIIRFNWVKFSEMENVLLKIMPTLVGPKPLLPRQASLLYHCGTTDCLIFSVEDIAGEIDQKAACK